MLYACVAYFISELKSLLENVGNPKPVDGAHGKAYLFGLRNEGRVENTHLPRIC